MIDPVVVLQRYNEYEVLVKIDGHKIYFSVEPPGLYFVFEDPIPGNQDMADIAARLAKKASETLGCEVNSQCIG